MNGGILLGFMLLIVSLIAFGLLIIVFGQGEKIKEQDKLIDAYKAELRKLKKYYLKGFN